jgi:HSP20 family molecular chaperone IbpA
VPKEKVQVDYDGVRNVLSLSGSSEETKDESREEGGMKTHYSERRYGAFRREFQLPDGCKGRTGEISAKSTDGVIEIKCPKTAIEEPKKFQIAIQ